ncbi:hypothetical protein HIM_00203 [Hirsutella minnesotensis 3608]|nr:hypothetical protein HIM_00203 [Hirsutella minnesotensis 3608]
MGRHLTAPRQYADAEAPAVPQTAVPGSVHEPPPRLDNSPPVSSSTKLGSSTPSSYPRLRSPSASRWSRFWAPNKAALVVALSQLFGAIMNLCARLLELEGGGMHPVQVVFLRQSVTAVCCLIYMRWSRTPDCSWGKGKTGWLLLIRGMSGFFSVFGLWYSMLYLPLADATVISYFSPSVTVVLCYFFLREPFSRIEALATGMALLGVVLVAQPAALFARPSAPALEPVKNGLPGADHEATAGDRLLAVGAAMVGVFGAAGVFTTLRIIGKRVHPVMSVHVFAVCCTVICTLALGLGPLLNIDQPSLQWATPTSSRQWVLLLALGLSGFAMQYLVTAGLAADSSNRANAMVYTQMLFAPAFDWWVFGHRMGLMSFLGCTLVLGSAIGTVVIVPKKPSPPSPLIEMEEVERQGVAGGDEESSPMLALAPARHLVDEDGRAEKE